MRPEVRTMGHAFFAGTMIALGILQLKTGDFTPMWAGVPAGFFARGALVYLFAITSVVAGVGILWRRTALLGADLLLGAFVVLLVVFRGPVALSHPTSSGAWWAVGDTAAMSAATWVLFVWFAGTRDRARLNFAAGDKGLRIARALYGFGMIPLGIAHFTYLERTVSLVPAWLPWHLAWACFTGGAFIAAGLGILTGIYARLAATLTTLQMAGFTLLVWVPILVAGHPTPMDLAEFIGSWSLVAAGWVVADSYRGVPWLGRGAAKAL